MTDIPAAVECVARAMAEADGYEPNEMISGGSNTFTMQAKDFNGYLTAHHAPAWKSYARQANLLIAAMNAARFYDDTNRP